MVNKKEKKYYSITELAKILGVSRVAVFKKIKKGEIEAIRIGSAWAILEEEVGKFLGKTLTVGQKAVVDEAVEKTLKEYGETLRLLGSN